MPASSKKKKEKNVDFAKAKLKLGKGKKPANNAIDTSFKARSIAVPLQTIGRNKGSSDPTTRRNLTLDDLLLHLKHYNANTRKDAINGLRELLEEYPDLIDGSLAAVLHACARVIADEDNDVRKLLHNFFAWLLRTVSPQQIRPYIQLLMLFITSAQTHIYPAIRIDAIRFIDVFLERAPDIIVRDWLQPDTTGSRVLEGYLSLLNTSFKVSSTSQDDAPGPSSANVTLSKNSRLVVLSSLATFLEKALLPLGTSEQASLIPRWIFAPYFTSQHELDAFCALVYPSRTEDQSPQNVYWNESQGIFVGPFEKYCLIEGSEIHDTWLSSEETEILVQDSDQVSLASQSKFLRNETLIQLARTLQPILKTTFLDVAAVVFFPVLGVIVDPTDMELAFSVLKIAGCLYGELIRKADIPESVKGSVKDDLYVLLSHMAAYLPVGLINNDFEYEELVRSMSFSYCELVSLTLLLGPNDASETSSELRRKRDKGLTIQLQTVAEFILQTLTGKTLPGTPALSTSAYMKLLPTLWYLLTQKSPSPSLPMIRTACINHSIRLHSKMGSKTASTQLIGIFSLFCGLGDGRSQSINVTEDEVVCLKEWYQQLPKTLWETGASDSNLTEIILLLLLRISQRRVRFFDENSHVAVISRLVPFFMTTHPQKGEMAGPFTKLKSTQLRRLALDVANVLIHDHGTASAGLRAAVERAVVDTRDTVHML